MRVYDKAQWHIDAGEDKSEVVNKFKAIFTFLNEESLLSPDGKEIFDLGIDGSICLNDKMLNNNGKVFIVKYYDRVINYNSEKIVDELYKLLKK